MSGPSGSRSRSRPRHRADVSFYPTDRARSTTWGVGPGGSCDQRQCRTLNGAFQLDFGFGGSEITYDCNDLPCSYQCQRGKMAIFPTESFRLNNLEVGNECYTPFEDTWSTFRNRYLIEKMEWETGFDVSPFLSMSSRKLTCRTKRSGAIRSVILTRPLKSSTSFALPRRTTSRLIRC